MRKVPVTEAVCMVLCHDITRIIPGEEKSRAFRKGQMITPADIPRLQALGKEHVYAWEAVPGLVHEDDAALRLARAAAGPGIEWSKPSQGKVTLSSQYNGLLKVSVDQLDCVNSLENMAFAVLHNNRVVKQGETLGGTRIIPLTIAGAVLEQAETYCSHPRPMIEVKPFRPLWVGVVTTGTEVYEGRIQDGFGTVLRQKITPYGGRMLGQVIVPDDPLAICAEIMRLIAEGADLVLVTGGMSVDPDDVSPLGIKNAGADVVFYGAPVLPGAMFMLAYQGHVPICGVPGCAMYNKTTILDLVLPRLFAEERIARSEIVALGHGGLCMECPTCIFPRCSFGKGWR